MVTNQLFAYIGNEKDCGDEVAYISSVFSKRIEAKFLIRYLSIANYKFAIHRFGPIHWGISRHVLRDNWIL